MITHDLWSLGPEVWSLGFGLESKIRTKEILQQNVAARTEFKSALRVDSSIGPFSEPCSWFEQAPIPRPLLSIKHALFPLTMLQPCLLKSLLYSPSSHNLLPPPPHSAPTLARSDADPPNRNLSLPCLNERTVAPLPALKLNRTFAVQPPLLVFCLHLSPASMKHT